MQRLRKGDAWKAGLLCLLIAATGWFIFRTFSQTKAANSLQVAPPQSKPSPDPLASASKEMFAPRTRPSASLGKAATASDPFRPYVSTEPVTVSDTKPARTAHPAIPPAPELEGVRLSGVILGPDPVAVLRTADQRYFLHRGDLLAGGWRVHEIGARSVVLAKSGKRINLKVPKEGRSAPPAAAR